MIVLFGCTAVYWPVVAGQLVGSGDALRLYIPDAYVLLQHLHDLALPHWNGAVGLGQPLGASLQAQAYYPVRWVSLLTHDAVSSVTLLHVLHVWIAAVGAFFAARRSRLSSASVTVVAIAYAASPLFTHLVARPNLAAAAAWTPWIFYAAQRLGAERSRRTVALLALFFALSGLSAAPEITAGQAFCAAIILAGRGFKPLALGAMAGVFAFALGAITFIPFIEFLGESNRAGPSIALAWSASPPQLLSLFWLNADLPRAAGALDQQLVLSLFVGSSVAVLCAFALLKRFRRVRWLLIPIVVLMLLALGRHVPLLRDGLALLPFRYPAKHLVTAAFPICLLAGHGVGPLVAVLRRANWKRILLVLALWIVAAAASLPLQRQGAVGGFIFGVLFATALLATRFGRRFAMVVVMAELFTAHALLGMPEWVSAEKLRTPTTLFDKATVLRGERVAVNPALDDDERPPGDDAMSRHLLLPNRFVEEGLAGVTAYGSPLPHRTEAIMETADLVLLEMLSVRYAVGYWATPKRDDVTPLSPWPRAWIVARAEAAEDDGLSAVLTEPTLLRTTAVGAELPSLVGEPPENASAEVVRIRHESMTVKTSSPVDGLVVTSDLWFPGWRATVDGRETPVLRANYAMRAVAVPAGAHDVEFRYTPTNFTLAAGMSGLAVALLAVAIAWRPVRRTSRRR